MASVHCLRGADICSGMWGPINLLILYLTRCLIPKCMLQRGSCMPCKLAEASASGAGRGGGGAAAGGARVLVVHQPHQPARLVGAGLPVLERQPGAREAGARRLPAPRPQARALPCAWARHAQHTMRSALSHACSQHAE